jgi:DNA mismatch repair protein MutS
LPLFTAAPAAAVMPTNPGPSALDTALGEVNPDELSPRDALEIIYRLKSLSGGDG